MKFTKFIVLGAGVIGVISFFMPLMAVEGVKDTVSAMQIVKGLDTLKDAAEKGKDMADSVDTSGMGDDAAEAKKGIKAGADTASKAATAATIIVLLPFIICALFILFGVLGLKRFGRGLGIGTFLLAIVAGMVWMLLKAAADKVAEMGGVDSATGSGMTMLMLAVGLALVGGLLAIIKPEKKAAA